MKRTILSGLVFLLFGCGPNKEELQEIAIITCNIMAESRNMDAAMRIREINNARKEIGESAFLGTDKEIKEAFQYGLCHELVLNDLSYSSQLNVLKEQEKIELSRRFEEERVAKLEREERERLAKLEREERERLAKLKREEQERITFLKNQQEYTDLILGLFAEYPPRYSDGKLTKPYNQYLLEYNCLNTQGLIIDIKIEFTDNLGSINYSDNYGYCQPDGTNHVAIEKSQMKGEILRLYDDGLDAFYSKVDKVTIEWNGSINTFFYKNNLNSDNGIEEVIPMLDYNKYIGIDPELSRLPNTWVIYENELN
jgi:hypothetical protein